MCLCVCVCVCVGVGVGACMCACVLRIIYRPDFALYNYFNYCYWSKAVFICSGPEKTTTVCCMLNYTSFCCFLFLFFCCSILMNSKLFHFNSAFTEKGRCILRGQVQLYGILFRVGQIYTKKSLCSSAVN